jgi:hypothetical protein
MSERLSSQSTTTEAPAMIAIDHRNPLASCTNGSPPTFIPKMPAIRRRHEECGDDGQHMQIAVGLLGRLHGDLLLEEVGPVAQRDDLGIEPFEALTQPCRGETERELLGEIEPRAAA